MRKILILLLLSVKHLSVTSANRSTSIKTAMNWWTQYQLESYRASWSKSYWKDIHISSWGWICRQDYGQIQESHVELISRLFYKKRDLNTYTRKWWVFIEVCFLWSLWYCVKKFQICSDNQGMTSFLFFLTFWDWIKIWDFENLNLVKFNFNFGSMLPKIKTMKIVLLSYQLFCVLLHETKAFKSH